MTIHHPDVPEAVALELFKRILDAEGKENPPRGRNIPVRADLLALYAECLKTVNASAAVDPRPGFLN